MPLPLCGDSSRHKCARGLGATIYLCGLRFGVRILGRLAPMFRSLIRLAAQQGAGVVLYARGDPERVLWKSYRSNSTAVKRNLEENCQGGTKRALSGVLDLTEPFTRQIAP